ncbi:DUF4423 domain-containing protein [Bdellovibrio bacteriovorus]|uniref:DUF4423 domain-containing protein n=1 Tax=Bdellovibrio bacteriovorus TaxID=959 RepID=A0A150WTN5_BDEBC|nr:DUF4423 domain-containing protein [Bdellovibrio bacteriovorus]KYG69813.1 hypothetical protein AZI85_16330 [Bdellovibrio bacteriovorus]
MNDGKKNQDFVDFLRFTFDAKKKVNPRYSLRSFALFIDVDNSRLSKILRNERPVHPELVERIGKKLRLSSEEIDRYKVLEANKYRRKALPVTPKKIVPYKQISEDSFRIISDITHYQVLELMKLKSFEPNLKWVAKAIGISEKQATECRDRLMRVGLLQIDEKGRWTDSSEGFSTDILSETRASEAHRKMQSEILVRAHQALEKFTLEERDQSSMMMATSAKKLLEAKRMIKQFRRKLGQFLDDCDEKDQIYQLSISLYPLIDKT